MKRKPSRYLPVTSGDITGTKLPASHKPVLRGKLELILRALQSLNGVWVTEDELLARLAMLFPGEHINPKTLSVQIRNLRKPKVGGHRIDQRYREDCDLLSEYQLIP